MQPTYFREFDDLFERMGWSGATGDDFAVDVTHDDDEIVVTADVPGFENEDLDVTVDDDVLTIRAESGAEETASEDTYLRRERHRHAMRRTLHLPAEVDGDGAEATYRNGVLTIRLPVADDGDVRHIRVDE